MYLAHFGLKEVPFSIAPNPHYLYLSRKHQNALAHLLYGVQSGGFIMLTGEVGAGKTTLCRSFLKQVPENIDVAMLLNPRQNAVELLASICDELCIQRPESAEIKILVDLINRHLLHTHSQGRKTLLIVDEAQNLDNEVLEQLRLLTNLETDEHKLLQIILIGQPSLRKKIRDPDLWQLSQRITARYHLGPLERKEIAGYLEHRLALCGVQRPLFTTTAISLLYRRSRGIPRLINTICDRALLGAYAKGYEKVNTRILNQAANEVLGNDINHFYAVAAVLTALLLGSLLWFWSPANIDVRSVVSVSDESQSLLIQGNAADSAETIATAEDKVPESTAADASEVALASSIPNARAPVAQLNFPEALGVQTSRDAAFVNLHYLWKRNYLPKRDGNPCLYAQNNRLLCLSDRGNLSELRRLNRPAVLSNVRADNGDLLTAGLLEIDEESALLTLGTELKKISHALLQSRWGGEYTLFWRPPNAYTGPLSYREKGPLVTWVARQRSRMEDNAPLQTAWTLEGELHTWMRNFQREQGLRVDGIAGPKTLIMLRNALGDEVPRLVVSRIE